MRSTVCSSERSATTRTASVDDTSRSSCDGVVVGAHGTTTPPIFHVPRTASSQSTVLPGHDDDAVAGADLALAEAVAQTVAPSAISMNERCSMMPVAREERQRAALGIARERLDDVAREVEAIGDLPAAVDERRAEGKLERRAGQLVSAPTAPADAKTFHGYGLSTRIGVS